MAEEETEEKKPGGLKKIIILSVVVLLLIAGSVGGTLFAIGFFDKKPETEQAKEEKVDDAIIEIKKDAPSYIVITGMKPEITVNLPKGSGANFLQVEVTALTFYDEVYNAIKKHMPRIRNSLVLLFSSVDGKTLRTVEGRKQLQKKVFDDIQSNIKPYLEHNVGIEQVYFTKFVMQ